MFDVVVRYGFMEDPNVPEALALVRECGLALDTATSHIFLGRETLIVTPRTRHGDVAGTAVRGDGTQCRQSDGLFQASA